jgi:hypothetical protein
LDFAQLIGAKAAAQEIRDNETKILMGFIENKTISIEN